MKIVIASIFLMMVAGCARPIQRFVPFGDTAALDTKTGRACNPFTSKMGPTNLPLCYDLYKETEYEGIP